MVTKYNNAPLEVDGKLPKVLLPRGMAKGGENDSMWRSLYCVDGKNTWSHKPAASSLVYPTCHYTASFPLNSGIINNTISKSTPYDFGGNDIDGRKRDYSMSAEFTIANKKQDCSDMTHNGLCKGWVGYKKFTLGEDGEFSLTDDVSYTTGPYSYGDAHKLYERYRCHRVLVYRGITHNGIKYDDTKLQNPDYVLRKKGWEIKPTWEGETYIPGVAQADSPLTLEPFCFNWGELKYPTYYADTRDNANNPPVGYEYDADSTIDNITVDHIDRLSGFAIYECFRRNGSANGQYISRLDETSNKKQWLTYVPAGMKHTLILECNIYFCKIIKLNKKPAKNGGWQVDGATEIYNEFMGVFGDAHVLI